MKKQNQGFSLIELSIVITIIALVVGGIVIGKSVIHNAELQSVIADVDRFRNAVKLFREKYRELPGDIPTATTFWGTDTACPTTDPNTTPKLATCNGDGNGYIVDAQAADYIEDADYWEAIRLWQHLANAEFIEGAYNGTRSSGVTPNGLDPGINIPKSRIIGNSYTFFYVAPGSSTNTYTANYRHVIVYGQATGLDVDSPTLNAGISTQDAYNIDSKIDDGKPGMGPVLSYKHTFMENCATTDVENTALYDVGEEGLNCSLIFITGF